jgi:D-arabinonate dehydratase
MVDANNIYNRIQALKMGRSLEKYDIFWFEEPLRPDDLYGSAKLVDSLDIPIAGGELESGIQRFKDLIDAKAFDILQPDIMVCGGISEWLKIANLSKLYGLQVAPHSVHDIHVHLASITSNCKFIEFFDKYADLTKYSELYYGYREPVDGYLTAPDTNGLGTEINTDTIKKYKIN